MNPSSHTSPPTPEIQLIRTIQESPAFQDYHPEDVSWQPAFREVIILLDELLDQAERAGKRIDFTEEVGVHGKVQDITSLVQGMRQALAVDLSALRDQKMENRLNRYKGAGVGYFANGAFFSCDHPGEMAFFLDEQRIYLNRHIRAAIRAVQASPAFSK